ncbi:MAG: [FeFe] hydrogenase H-cluster radical SAM maturase HydE [Proteobacteria bacterium]|nr:[FeFe] hydrogenase H-cluster radical SAM maturase HydE [Pseudomonadota bacterium]
MERAEILESLRARGQEQSELFAAARDVRRQAFGDQAFVRGVVELTSYCRKDCTYCAMRLSNRKLERFRASADDVMAAAEAIAEAGISTILLQGGEDVQSDKVLDAVIPRIKAELGLFIILNVGERRRERFEQFRALGADSYIMKFESSDPLLYEQATRSDLAVRLQNLRWLRELGFVVGTGNIVGLPGQTLESIADDLLTAAEMSSDFVSTSPFIPNGDTPWENQPSGCLETALNVIAVSRILRPNALVPAVSALEKVEAGGQLRGLQAGANVITINFTPDAQRSKYRIYSERRFTVSTEHAFRILREAGLAHQRRGPLTPPRSEELAV